MSNEVSDGQAYGLPVHLLNDALTVAESRLLEAKLVTPSTYSDLEYCFNEAYREQKQNFAKVTFEISKTEKAIDDEKGRLLIDEYPVFLEQNPKLKDTADIKKAFLCRDKTISDLSDKLNTLKALEVVIDGKIKVMERTCSYMRKKMDLIIRSGVPAFTQR
jgi:hypothetical protein